MGKDKSKDKKPAPTGNTGTKGDKVKVKVQVPSGNLGTFTKEKMRNR